MNKIIFLAIGMLASVTFAAEQNLVMSCRTKFMNDGGHQIDIVAGGIVPDLEIALIKEVRRKPTDYTDAIILKRNDFGTHLKFSGKNFAMSVQLESRSPSSIKNGELSYDGKNEDVACVRPETN